MKSLLKKPFATILQDILIVLLLLSLVLIGQQWSINLYQAGLILLVICTLLQIAVGNIPSNADFRQSVKFIALILMIVAIVFIAGILLVPSLVKMARG
jgi:hypothetical protein